MRAFTLADDGRMVVLYETKENSMPVYNTYLLTGNLGGDFEWTQVYSHEKLFSWDVEFPPSGPAQFCARTDTEDLLCSHP